jgi:hypothetical protein
MPGIVTGIVTVCRFALRTVLELYKGLQLRAAADKHVKHSGSHGRRSDSAGGTVSAYGVQQQRGGRLKETDGALGGGVGSGKRHPFDFGVRVYGVM